MGAYASPFPPVVKHGSRYQKWRNGATYRLGASARALAANDAALASRRNFLARHEYRRTDVEELGQFSGQGRADLSLAGENR
jgi:hypothetical protein